MKEYHRCPIPSHTRALGPPTNHQLALKSWLSVFPTLALLNLPLGDWMRPMSPALRTFVLATVAITIVIYGSMPQLHKVRFPLMTQRANP